MLRTTLRFATAPAPRPQTVLPCGESGVLTDESLPDSFRKDRLVSRPLHERCWWDEEELVNAYEGALLESRNSVS